jgi:NADH-quinone oxidoreductase subunit J
VEANQIIIVAAITGAIALWLMLPRGTGRGRLLGALIGLVSLGFFAALLSRLGSWGDDSVFWVLAGVTLVSAGATITFRSPVYCAVWFAQSLLGTAGLFLVQGAQFLAVATIVVYAGAILVTFLFVLMLAQSTGRAVYDRMSWEPLVAAATGAVLVGILSRSLVDSSLFGLAAKSQSELGRNILSEEHVAHLGTELFSKYLVPVEIAGTLLLVALVGAIAMAESTKGERRKTKVALGAGSNGRPSAAARPRTEALHE